MSADGDGNNFIWDVNENLPLSQFNHMEGTQVWDACWNNMGTILATCAGDKLVKLWGDGNVMKSDA